MGRHRPLYWKGRGYQCTASTRKSFFIGFYRLLAIHSANGEVAVLQTQAELDMGRVGRSAFMRAGEIREIFSHRRADNRPARCGRSDSRFVPATRVLSRAVHDESVRRERICLFTIRFSFRNPSPCRTWIRLVGARRPLDRHEQWWRP